MLDFDVPLDDIAWIDVADGRDVLVKGGLILLLLVMTIRVFLANLSDDVLGEVSCPGNSGSLIKHLAFK